MNFEQAIRAAGLLPRDVVADGKLYRCATKTHPHRRNGWFLLHLDGRRGVWGDNAVAPRQALGTWTAEGSEHHVPSAEEQERQRKAREQARANRIRAISGARSFWNHARACTRLHPYLMDKGLSALGTAGVKEAEGFLVIPVRWNGLVISVQTIHPTGQKRFWTGAPVKGGCFVLERERAAITVLVEGYATGLAVFQSMRHARVVVCFDAGNLLPVVQAIKPTGSVVIAGDNDYSTQAKRGFNPGVEKATNAAELIGCGVAYPQGIEGSDYADMLKELGPMGAKRIEREIQAQARYVMASMEHPP